MNQVLRTAALAMLLGSSAGHAQDLSYLLGLLSTTPAGGWVKASTNEFSDAWATGSVGIPVTGFGGTKNVVDAWSSMAWDSTRGNLMFWGGGHASYQGNEMYVWQGSNGTWTRGSLPSNIQTVANATDIRTRLVVDDKAPQSAHTYEGNLYLPVNDMFMTVGGPVFNDAGLFTVRNASGSLVSAGPWMWDPSKADANKVGGSTGSGYDPATLGGNMWINRGAQWKSQVPGLRHFVSNTTAYRQEANQDVVYVTFSDGGWHSLYRYAPGDVRNGNGIDQWQLVGTPGYQAAALESSGTIDTLHNLYLSTATHPSTIGTFDLTVWNLNTPGNNNSSKAVNLSMADGSPFQITGAFAIEYDKDNDQIYMFDGSAQGKIYRTKAVFNPDGSIAPQWKVEALTSTTASQPAGGYKYGVYGKFLYVDALDAFVVMDTFVDATQDAAVWLYKPLLAGAVPEPSTVALWLAGLGLGLGRVLQRRRQGTA